MRAGPTTEEVATPSGAIDVHIWTPDSAPELTVVTVHPWAPLGGGGVARVLRQERPAVLCDKGDLQHRQRAGSDVSGALRTERTGCCGHGA